MFGTGLQLSALARPWAYTVGLCQANHPELLTFGLGTCHAGPLLNWVADQHRAGDRLPVGRDHQIQFQGVQIRLVPVPDRCVDPTQGLMARWHQYYSAFGPYPGPQVLQVVHADGRSRFPWHADYDRGLRFAQPVLEDDPLALRRQKSPVGPSRRTHAAKPRQRRR